VVLVPGALRGVCTYLYRTRLFGVAYGLEYDLRVGMFSHLTRLPFSFYDRVQSGQLISRANSDIRSVQMFLTFAPLMVLNALHGDPLPVYGDGMQVRNWIYVEDFARGIGHVLEHGVPGETYNVGGPDEAVNLDVVRGVIALTGASEDLIEYVTDRPGHDRRYSLSSAKLRDEIGWEAEVRFEEGLRRTVEWYRENESWWRPIRSGEYRDYYERQYGRALGG
jgi:dTDP-glucose 4,6-dehydratase